MAKTKVAVKTQLDAARRLEKEGKYADALKIYRTLTRGKQLNADAYTRMMIIYRKQKKYDAELKAIQQAIAAAERSLTSTQQAITDTDRDSAALSRKLAGALDLLDEDGIPLYGVLPLATWRRREAVVEKRRASRQNRKRK